LLLATGVVGNAGTPLGGADGRAGAPDGGLLTSKLISPLLGVTVGGLGSSRLGFVGGLGASFIASELLEGLSFPPKALAATIGIPKILALAKVDMALPPLELLGGAMVSEGGLLFVKGGGGEEVGSGIEVLVVEPVSAATGAGVTGGVVFLSTADKSMGGGVCPPVCNTGRVGGIVGGLDARSVVIGLVASGSSTGAVVCGGTLGGVF
jgi:hypothetical protein